MDILIISTTILLPLLIGYFLGSSRDNNKIIFNKKLDIYQDIIYHLSSAKYLKLNIDINEQKLESLVKDIDSLQGSTQSINSLHPINQKFESLKDQISITNYRDELIKLFAPARLIAGEKVVNELRNYFSLISEYHLISGKNDITDLSNKISISVMELEQLMREDLGYFRIISKFDIWWYTRKR